RLRRHRHVRRTQHHQRRRAAPPRQQGAAGSQAPRQGPGLALLRAPRERSAQRAHGGLNDMASLLRSIDAAAERLRDRVRKTPTESSAVLSEMAGCRVHLKLENLQLTGSFKLRGALNKLLCIPAEQRERGVVAASSGNHGAGVACAAASLACPATVFVPEATTDAKAHAIASRGAEVIRFGHDCVQTEAHARAVAEERGQSYVSPYNDLDVVAGQATVGVELLHQLEDFAAVFVALGGGGLISGIGTYLKSRGRGIDIVACSPEHSPVM